MIVFKANLKRTTLVLMFLALALVPILQVHPHGPAVFHADAYHAEQGDPWQAEDDAHHVAIDHDHSTTVILPGHHDLAPQLGKDVQSLQQVSLAGIAGDGLRRPPRRTV